MVYEEFPEWKRLKKEKKYKEAVEKLMYETAVNLMRVSNLYCERKHDPYEEYYIAYGPCYGENKNGLVEDKVHDYIPIAGRVECLNIYLKDLDEKDDIPYHCRYIIKELLKNKKKLMNLIKNIVEE